MVTMPTLSNQTITKRTAGNLTKLTVEEITSFYLDRLQTLAVSAFEYRGLPETMDRRYMEHCILHSGSVCIGDPIAAPGMPVNHYWAQDSSGIDQYGYPGGVRMIDARGQSIDTVKYELLFDSPRFNSSPMINRLKLYARDLTLLHLSFHRNLKQQMRPFVFAGSKKLSSTMDNIFSELDDFTPYIQISDEIDMDSLQVLQTGVTFQGLDFLEARRQVWADAIGSLGISSETTKKERLITDEVVINRQEDTILLNGRLMQRLETMEKINKRWGLNITVNMSADASSFAPEPEVENTSQTEDIVNMESGVA